MLKKIGSTHEYVFQLDLKKLKKFGYDAVVLQEMQNEMIVVDVTLLESPDGINALYCIATPDDDRAPFFEDDTALDASELAEENIINNAELFFKGELEGMGPELFKKTKHTINAILFTLSESEILSQYNGNKYYTEDGFRAIDEECYSDFVNSNKYKSLQSKIIKNKKQSLKNNKNGGKIVKIDFKNKNE